MTDVGRAAIGLAVAIALIGAAILFDARPSDDVAFLERLASRVERVQTVAPATRDYFSELMGRYETPLADARLDARRQKALARINTVLRLTGAPETVASGGEDDLSVLIRTVAPTK